MTDEVVDEGPGESVDLAEEVIEETVAEAERVAWACASEIRFGEET